jgi:NitT/TauT family transport system substrate-binding protein
VTKKSAVSRRTILGTAGAAGLAGTLGMLAKPAIVHSAGLQKIRFGWAQPAACFAPIAYAANTGVFARHGIDAELVDFYASGNEELIQFMAAGKLDVAAGFLLGWLKPMDEGLDVRLISGTHAGCTRLLTTQASGIKQAIDLRGKTIAIAQSNGPAQQVFAVTLIKAGVNPDKDITWKVFPDNLLAAVVQKGEADALAHFDPQTFGWMKDERLIEIANNQSGVYDNLSCCTVGAHANFLKGDKALIRSTVEAIIETHEVVAKNPAAVAKFYKDTYKPPVSEEMLVGLLGQLAYHHHPAGPALQREIAEEIDDLKLIGVFKRDADSQALAQKFTYNVFA